jgi:uncharacterized membrane-anchored protein YitT (DUF2179 family)
MKNLEKIRKSLLAVSIIGFVFINIPFLYISVLEREIYREAMGNPLALVFISEAFLLMFFIAFLIHRKGYKSPGWFAFIVFSILGSLAFSIPFFLYLHAKTKLDQPAAGGDRVR